MKDSPVEIHKRIDQNNNSDPDQSSCKKRAKKKSNERENEKTATFLNHDYLTKAQSPRLESKLKNKSDKRSSKPGTDKNSIHRTTETKSDENMNASARNKAKLSKTSPIQKSETKYWAYLLSTLKRVVDEIYVSCENDRHICKCEEVILMLEKCVADFQLLVDKIKMINRIENMSKTQNSVAWEIGGKAVRSKHLSIGSDNEPTTEETGFRDFVVDKESNTHKPDLDMNGVHRVNVASWSNSPQGYTNFPNYTPNFEPNICPFPAPYQSESSPLVYFSNASQPVVSPNVSLDRLLNNKLIFNIFSTADGLASLYSNQQEAEKNEKNLDINHNNMLKLYEEEEKTIEDEIKQDEKLLIVLEKEAQLTRQLSVEELIHLFHFDQFEVDRYMKGFNFDPNTDSKSNRNMMMNDGGKFEFEKKFDEEDQNSFIRGFYTEDLDLEPVQTPSRASQIHEKLNNIPRKESPNQRRRKHEEKQARAQEKREQFYQDRLDKLKELTKKIEKVNELKKKLIRAKKATLKAKLQRAEEKRLYLLQEKAAKASVEEQKAHEIAFINSLTAQNRKHDILEKYEKRNETIKQNLEEERQRKQEEQKAKELAAELRRRELESRRMARLSEMLEKRRLKESKIEQNQLEKEKERQEVARAKEKTREMRLATIEAQFQANKQQARRKILQKQEEWSKRHELNLEEIRKKAFEMSVLRFSSDDQSGSGVDTTASIPYEKAKYCKVCQTVIGSEIQLKLHLRGIKHQQTMNDQNQSKNMSKTEVEDFNLSCIVDAPKELYENDLAVNQERLKSMKKRSKKLKNKILISGFNYETSKKEADKSNPEISVKSKIPKLLKELEKISNSNDRYNPNVDKICGELNRLLPKNKQDQSVFLAHNGLQIFIKLLEQINNININENNQIISAVSTEIITNSTSTTNNLMCVLNNSIPASLDSCVELLLSNKFLSLVEILYLHSSIIFNQIGHYDSSMCSSSVSSKSDQARISNEWSICSNLFNLIAAVFSAICELDDPKLTKLSKKEVVDLNQRAMDFISLFANNGVIDTLSVFFGRIRGPIEENEQDGQVLRNGLKFLVSVTKYLIQRGPVIFPDKKADDSTQLISTLKATNLVNIVSMLYGLLHKDASTPIKSTNATTVQNQNVNYKAKDMIDLDLTTLGIRLLNQIIILDLNTFQNLLGEESLSLQLRHIVSYLIWYSNSNKLDQLLHELILFVGYYTVLNDENQLKIELGTPPTILQQLCNLPFNYFSDKRLISILCPTLISFCFRNEKNKVVLCNELNGNILANFIAEQIKETKKSNEDDAFEFRNRFPVRLWKEAFDFFINH